MTDLLITVHGTPAPQGSKRGYVNRHTGRVAMVESSKAVKPWREAVKYAALEALRDSPQRVMRGAVEAAEPLLGPVAVTVTFRLSRPKHHYRTGANAHLLRDGAPTWPATKPDLDKLLRSTLDGLGEAGCWRDDAQVAEVSVAKVYGQPGAEIRVEALDGTS